MRFKRVLLVSPSYVNTHYKTVDLPAGLGYISEALNHANIENKVFDMRLGYGKKDLINYIDKYNPDLIGFSMMSFGYIYNYSIISVIKNIFKKVEIVLGGPHISTLRNKVLEECPEIDYGVTLEGDDTIVELCRSDLPLSSIKGLFYRQDGKVVYTGDRPWIEDLDRVNFPAFSSFEMEKYISGIPISTTRGCPYQCIFCPVQTAIGQRIRMRSVKSVIAEIEFWYSKGFTSFGITDDNFTFVPDRVRQICQEIKTRKITGLTFSCGNGIRADRVDRELLREMKSVGFKYVSFGVESANEHILEYLKKGEKLADIEKAVKDSCELGFAVTLFFLLGSPKENKEDLQRSMDFALKYEVYDVRFYNIIPFPGTELFEWLKDNRYLIKDIADYLNGGSHWINEPIFTTPELSFSDRRKLYLEFNRKVKKHTLKVKRKFHLNRIKEKLKRLGFPGWLSIILSRIYYSELFQLYIADNKPVYYFKRAILQKENE